jgi:hypothetical protein
MVAMLFAMSGCGSKDPATPAAAPPVTADATEPAPATAPVDAATAAQTLAPTATTWSPEAMEELLAPVALYPDIVLGQVLVSSTNPQEVLDAGNWLLQNQALQGNALDEAAKQVGFTPPIRGLLQSPEVVDMMASQMDWTAELGQAFVNDQQGVMDAVQRLRAQAKDVGNLQSSEQLKVATETQDGHEVITVSPPSPQVVYVPQYDPVAVYAPAPATVPAPAPVATDNKGHSTTALVTTGLLSFGAGILVANIFDDDDDDYYRNGYYNPRYYGPPMPYYPPYPYRPRYGNGYYPNSNYNRPPNYQHSFNNNTIIVNQNSNNDYWNRHDTKSASNRDSRSAKSPITAAKPNRPELNTLNAQAKQGPQRPAPTQADWKGQSGYAGASKDAPGKVAGAKPAASAAATSRDQPKVQGSYAGGTPSAGAASSRVSSAAQDKKPAAKTAAASAPRPAAVPAAKPKPTGATDRGYAKPTAAAPSKPAAAPERARPTAVSGADRGSADKAASQRGKQSMPSGVPAKAKKPSKPAKR